MEDSRKESVLYRRIAPKLAVLAPDGAILSSEPGLRAFLAGFSDVKWTGDERLPRPIDEAVNDVVAVRLSRQDEPPTAVCCPVPGLVVRATLLRGPEGICVAVSFERLQVRSDVRQTALDFGLSEREAEIAELLVQGLSAQHIAQRLHISRNTAREHLKHIHAKLRVNTRAQLISRLLNLSAT